MLEAHHQPRVRLFLPSFARSVPLLPTAAFRLHMFDDADKVGEDVMPTGTAPSTKYLRGEKHANRP